MDNLFSGVLGGIVILIVTSFGRQWDKYRGNKANKSVNVDTRLTNVESAVKTLNDGLFGTEDQFGRHGGFVHEIRQDIEKLTLAVNASNGHGHDNGVH